MLPLDSSRWVSLQHAYGSAESTPDVLREFEEIASQANPDAAVLEATWDALQTEVHNNLFHQQSTYSATYAAIPHLVRLGRIAPLRMQIRLLIDFGWINRLCWLNESDEDIKLWYQQGVQNGGELAIYVAQNNKLAPEQQFEILRAVADLHDQGEVALTIWNREEFDFACPECNSDLRASFVGGAYSVEGDSNEICKVTPAVLLNDVIETPRTRHLKTVWQIAKDANHDSFLAWMKQLLGSFNCPDCETKAQIDLPQAR